MRVRGLAARGAVEDALAAQPVEAVDREASPRDAAREDDRAGPQDVAAVEVQLARHGVDPGDRAGDEDLRAETPRLLQRPARELVPGDARRKAEVVLDPRRRTGLTAGRLPLDDDRPQALRRSVDRGGQARGTRADDDGVVLRALGLGSEPEQLGDPAKLGPDDGLAVDDADRRAVLVRRQRPAPHLLRVRRVRRHPPEGDLVAVEEAAQLGAGRVPAMPDDDRPRRRRLRRETLEAGRAADAVSRQPSDLLADVGRVGRDGVIVVRLESHHTRCLGRAEPDREHGPEGDRHLPEDLAGPALADDALDAVDDLYRLDPAGEQREERALVAGVGGVLAGREGDVGCGAREALALAGAELCKDRDSGDLLRGHHEATLPREASTRRIACAN